MKSICLFLCHFLCFQLLTGQPLRLNQEASRNFQPKYSIYTRQLNNNGRIQDRQQTAARLVPVPFSSWSPTTVYAQQTPPSIGRLNPIGRIVATTTTLIPDDSQDKSWTDASQTNKGPANDSELQKRAENGCGLSRSFSSLYSGARNFLTGALKRYATSGSLMLGSGLLAAAIPFSMLVIPGAELRARRDSQDSEEKPTGLPATKFSIQGRVDSVMGWIERSVEHLPNFPRLHPQECVKRSICEAHNEPNKYGAIGFVLRLFFPATNLSITDRMDDMEYKVINKYRYAAGYGLNKRIDNNGSGSAACREKYEDCLVSLLDVAQNLIDIFLK